MAFPVSEDRIEAAEAELGQVLPVHLRTRLMRDNGGEVRATGEVWWLFPVWDTTDRRTIKRTSNHILKENETAKEWYNFPEDAVAIAQDGCGNYLIFRDPAGPIEFWDHETGESEPADIDWG